MACFVCSPLCDVPPVLSLALPSLRQPAANEPPNCLLEEKVLPRNSSGRLIDMYGGGTIMSQVDGGWQRRASDTV